MIRRGREFALLLGFGLSAVAPAWASTIVLKNGGRIEGLIVNANERPVRSHQVQTKSGAIITVTPDQVREILDPKNVLAKYEAILPKMPRTADGNWKMAEWCREQELVAERTHHLRQVIELETDHAQARAALGYKQVNGAWENPEERWIALGYEKVGTKYLNRQQIEIGEETAAFEQMIKEAREQIKSLSMKANRGKDSEQALRELRALHSPAAMQVIVTDYLTVRPGNVQRNNLPGLELKKVYIDLVSKNATPLTTRALVKIYLNDPVENIRSFTLQKLVDAKHPSTTPILLQEMGNAIKAGKPVIVNQAARAIGSLQSEEAVFPLIAALTMKIKTESGGDGGGMSASPSFDSSTGSAGLSAGGKKVIIERDIQNPGVLDALRTITKVDFQYNAQDWKNWYIDKHTPRNVSLRRDE